MLSRRQSSFIFKIINILILFYYDKSSKIYSGKIQKNKKEKILYKKKVF